MIERPIRQVVMELFYAVVTCFLGVVGWLGYLCARGPCRVRRHRGRHLVGIVGKAGHGKDAIGDILENSHGFKKEAFAKPVKDAARVLWLFTDDQLYGKTKEVVDERWGISPRMAMQFLGTEVGREDFQRLMPQLGNGFWLEHFRRRHQEQIQKHKEDPADHTSNVVVCDVRFPNEAAVIRQLGGIVAKVTRPQKETIAAAAAGAGCDAKDVPDLVESAKKEGDSGEHKQQNIKGCVRFNGGHKSETEMDAIEPDVVIVNDGTLADLRDKVEALLVPAIRATPKRRKKTPKAE